MRRVDSRLVRPLVRIALLGLAATIAIVGCSPVASGAPPSQSAPASIATGATSGPTTASSLPSQTDTAWGRIWDAIPGSFPKPPDSQPATETGDIPTSAQVAVRTGTPESIAQFYLDALSAAGYSVGKDGPLEDGSITVTASDGYQCRMELSVLPIDVGSLVTVLYGAGCPFE